MGGPEMHSSMALFVRSWELSNSHRKKLGERGRVFWFFLGNIKSNKNYLIVGFVA